MRKVLGSVFFLFVFSTVGYCALSKTYPSGPVTELRFEVFNQVFKDIYESTYTVSYSTHDWDTSTNYLINEILDKEVEEFLVFPGTSAPTGWLGFCQDTINGKLVAIDCP